MHIVKQTTLLGHRDAIYAIEKKDDSNFFSAGSDGYVVKWALDNPENGELVAQVNNSVYAMHYIQESNTLLVGQNNEGIYKIDLQTNKIIASAQITNAQIFDIKKIENYILVATGDGYIIELQESDLSVISKQQYAIKSARSIAVHPNNKSYAVAFSDNTIRLFNIHNVLPIKELVGHSNSVFALTYSPNGNQLISGSRDASIKIWLCDEDYQLHASIPAHLYAINDLKFLGDSNYFASASMDKTIKIWDANTLRLLKVIDKARYESHRSSVNKLCAINNGLLSCSDDKTIHLWNIVSN